MTQEDYKQLAEILINCWENRCSEDCPWYEYSSDDGFQCKRYKSYSSIEQFFDDSLKALGIKEGIKEGINK